MMRSRKLQWMLRTMLFIAIALPFPLRAQQPPAEKPKAEASSALASSGNNNNNNDAAAKSAGSAKNNTALKPEPISAAARLAAAHTVFVKRGSGSDIPYTVIGESIQGWGRLMVVNVPEKADLIMDVESPEDTSGLTFGSSTPPVGAAKKVTPTGEPDRASSTWLTKQTAGGDVKLTVHDAKSGSVLWRAVEQVKSSIRKTSRENSLVEAAERLFVKFHDRLEPPPVLAR
ncbi:MAG TPA: hypothetical protein VNW97_14280 [Candidatus Saccharimonadales bacterium]|jgi:hypothetical protein|nr:hypothetical protein [Candidatus Saccharimonadales bacterium]